MPPINVVFLGVRELMSDIVRGFLDEPDIRITGDIPLDPSSVPAAIALSPDVVVVGSNGSGLPLARDLLRARPRLKVLEVRRDGRDWSLWELRPYEAVLFPPPGSTKSTLGEILLEAVRTARTSPL